MTGVQTCALPISELGDQRLPRLTYPRGRGTNGARRSVGALLPSSGLTCTCRRRTHLCTHRRPPPPPRAAGLLAPPPPPVSSSPAPPSPAPPLPAGPARPHAPGGAGGGPGLVKREEGAANLGGLARTGAGWLAGAPPAVSLGGALGGPLPALRVPCYRASGEDAPAGRHRRASTGADDHPPPGRAPPLRSAPPRAAPG